MASQLKQIVINAITEATNKTLFVGNNSILFDYQDYTVMIDYFLDIVFNKEYNITINQIVVENSQNSKEYTFDGDTEIENVLMEEFDIENWNDDEEFEFDEYLEENY